MRGIYWEHTCLLILASVLATVLVIPEKDMADVQEKALLAHILQKDIDAGVYNARELFVLGHHIFVTRFTRDDGLGRPGATGSGSPTRRPLIDARDFLRTSGPDSSSCAGCHHQPMVGGGGEFVANVFVGAQEREPVLFSVSQEFSAERGTTDIFGAGLIELVAREMTRDLHEIRNRAVAEARRRGTEVRYTLRTKSVAFGSIKAHPSGEVDSSGVRGVDRDLVVRPWSQKGVITSLRTFTVTAFNHHHGIQSEERFGLLKTGSVDFDRDGVAVELTTGDITAISLFQAMLPPPRFVPSADRVIAAEEKRGQKLFSQFGCENCHLSKIVLERAVYSEPGPFNLEGTLRDSEVTTPFRVDLSVQPGFDHLQRTTDGGVIVPLFSDLRRHVIADQETPFFGNEIVTQGFAPTDQFLTRRLWATGNTDPYGHRGDVTTVDEAIRHHGGEARDARITYETSPVGDRRALVRYLKAWTAPAYAVPTTAETRAALAKTNTLWREEATRRTLALRTLSDRLLSAQRRAERQAQRSRIHALRIAQELRRAYGVKHKGIASSDTQTEQWPIGLDLPYLTGDFATLLSGFTERAIAESAELAALRKSTNIVRSVENSLRESSAVWTNALLAARFAHPSKTGDAFGFLSHEAVLRNVAASIRSGSLILALDGIAAWVEDQTFRTEQIAFAATRAEAEANRMSAER